MIPKFRAIYQNEIYDVYGWNELEKVAYLCNIPRRYFDGETVHTVHQITVPIDEIELLEVSE